MHTGDGPPQHRSIEPSFRLPELLVYGYGAVHRGRAIRSHRHEGDPCIQAETLSIVSDDITGGNTRGFGK